MVRIPRAAALLAIAVALTLLGGSLMTPTERHVGPAIETAHETVAPEPGPDIVVILTDDQRTDEMRWLPGVRRTIVAKGTSFTQAFVPTGLCCPSRATILTGLYSHDTGVWKNGGTQGGWRTFQRLGGEQRSIAVSLQGAGYRTGLIGKYLNGFGHYAPAGSKPPGWSKFLAFRLPSRSGAYYDYHLGSRRQGFGHRPKDYSTDVLAKRAVRFITSTPAARPLFLYFAPFAPHHPFRPAPRDVNSLRHKIPRYHPPSVTAPLDGKPAYVQSLQPAKKARIKRVRERQAESLLAVDDAVTNIVGALRRSGRLHNTMIVFLSDNGIQIGEHRVFGKSVPYRETSSIPLAIRWDGHVTAGGTDDRLALNVDVAQTIADAADVPLRSDGLSLLGRTTRIGSVIEATSNGRYGRPAYCGWRTDRWLYVRYANGEEELYDELFDHYELTNLAADPGYVAVRDSLREHAEQACWPMPPGFSWSVANT